VTCISLRLNYTEPCKIADMSETSVEWDAGRVRRLRRALELSQQAFARELGVRQQTVSDWETGLYQPRGASVRVLSLVAERVGVTYGRLPPEDPADAPS
jgi:DNA-binding transcriptional regulator YiaG